LTGEFELLLFLSLAFVFYAFFFFLGLLLLPRGRRWAPVMSPAITTPAAPAESDGSGSVKGKSASGLSAVPKFTKPKKFVLKHSSQ